MTRKMEKRITMTQSFSYEHELIDAIPVPLFFMDLNGAFIRSNVAFNNFIGMSDKEVREKGIYQMLAPGNTEKHEEIDRILVESGYIQPFEEEAIGARGRLFNVVYRKSLIHDPDGNVTGIVTTINDLTDPERRGKGASCKRITKKSDPGWVSGNDCLV